MQEFTPKLDILPEPQRRLWGELGGVPEEFTLYGGTAIALHLGHRQSIDFDFFCWKNFAPLDLAAELPLLAGGTILQSEPNTLTMAVDRGGAVKVSFFGLPRLGHVAHAAVSSDNRLKVASLQDLSGTKVAVVQQRAEAKDYIDIDAILTDGRIDLAMALAAASAIYGSVFSPQNALKALTYFDEPELSGLQNSLKLRLVNAVRLVDLDHLPQVSRVSQK